MSDCLRQGEFGSLPFVQLPLLVLVDRGLTDGAKLVYCALLRFAFQKSVCFPSVGRIAKLLGISESTARRHVKDLESHGLIRIRSRVGESNLYDRTGCLENVYEDGKGFLNQSAINLMCEAGEQKVVEKIQAERHEVIELLISGGVDGVPDEVKVPGSVDDEVGAGNRPLLLKKPRVLVPNHEDTIASARRNEKRTSAQIKRREAVRVKRANDPEAVAKKQESKREVLLDRAYRGRLLGVNDVESEWRLAAGDVWPGDSRAYSAWGAKERGMVKSLCKRFGADEMVRAIPVIVRNWEDFVIRYGVKSAYPVVGIVVGYADSWVPEALKMCEDVLDTEGVESIWREAIEKKWPGGKGIYVCWGSSDRQVVREFLAQYGREETIEALVGIVHGWDKLVQRFSLNGYPGMRVVKAYANTWFPEMLNGSVVAGSVKDRAMADGEFDDVSGTRSAPKGIYNPFSRQ